VKFRCRGRHGGASRSIAVTLRWMTETDAETRVIEEAVRLIDSGLSDLMHRELVSTDEVSDLLLDVRMLLTAAELASASGPVEEPVGA